MSSYSKNIAIIRGIKDGFSADGGELSGLVRAEKYNTKLVIEATFINFAPLTQGRFVTAVTDGVHCEVVENGLFEGDSPLDTGKGFAALICYVNGRVFPVASAICGNFRGEALALKSEVEKRENFATEKGEGIGAYEDEAIAEENYYEYETYEGGGAVRADQDEEKERQKLHENEETSGSLEDEKRAVNGAYSGGNKKSPLAGGDFYGKMKEEIEGIFSAYPKVETLEKAIEGSRWVKISYADDCYYLFGVIYSGGKAEYICYGVPATDYVNPPESMRDICSYLPLPTEDAAGFWVMYQDAKTGATIKLDGA